MGSQIRLLNPMSTNTMFLWVSAFLFIGIIVLIFCTSGAKEAFKSLVTIPLEFFGILLIVGTPIMLYVLFLKSCATN